MAKLFTGVADGQHHPLFQCESHPCKHAHCEFMAKYFVYLKSTEHLSSSILHIARLNSQKAIVGFLLKAST